MKLKSLLLGGVAAIVLVAAGGVGGVLATRAFSRPAVARRDPPASHAVYFAAMDPLVVSVAPPASGSLLPVAGTYLQISFQFQSDDAKAVAAFKTLTPAIRGRVMKLMLTLPVSVLDSQVARERMKGKVLANVNAVVHANDQSLGPHPFNHVYITDFVTQPD